MMAFWKKPDLIEIPDTDETQVELALAKLDRADVYFQEATEILETFMRDFKKKQKNEQ